MAAEVRDDAAAKRYELAAEGGVAIAVYRREGDVVDLVHTEVPDALAGRGLASRLIAGALADIRARGLTMRPSCPFVAAYVAKHPEVRDLLA